MYPSKKYIYPYLYRHEPALRDLFKSFQFRKKHSSRAQMSNEENFSIGTHSTTDIFFILLTDLRSDIFLPPSEHKIIYSLKFIVLMYIEILYTKNVSHLP